MAGFFTSLLALLGCDNAGIEQLVPGQSTEADVRKALGTPEIVREEDSGARRLEYPRGPEGQRTWFVWLDARGKFVRAEQVLRPDNFARIRAGMDEDEVRRILGKPTLVERFALRPDETVWTWRWLQDSHDAMEFSAYLGADGAVRRTEIRDDPRMMAGR